MPEAPLIQSNPLFLNNSVCPAAEVMPCCTPVASSTAAVENTSSPGEDVTIPDIAAEPGAAKPTGVPNGLL